MKRNSYSLPILVLILIHFTHPAVAEMSEVVSNHCHQIYQGIFRLTDPILATELIHDFAERRNMTKDEFSEELCTMIRSESIMTYPRSDIFRITLIQYLGLVGTTNCFETLHSIIRKENDNSKAAAAVALLRINQFSSDSLSQIVPYMDNKMVGALVYSELDTELEFGKPNEIIRNAFLDFLRLMTLTEVNHCSFIDIILCRECPDYPNCDLRKAMFQRLERPIPGSEQTDEVHKEEPALSEENATEEECEKQSKCRNTWLIGTLAGIIAGGFWALYWKVLKRKHAGVA